MRLLCTLLLTLTWGSPAYSELPEGILTVEVGGLVDREGFLFVSVYNSRDGWLGEEPFMRKRLDMTEARDGDFVVTELILPIGEYAISAYHDANGNGELDTSFLGTPEEPIAISNNARSRMGAPSYDDAKFELQLEPVIQRIKLVEL